MIAIEERLVTDSTMKSAKSAQLGMIYLPDAYASWQGTAEQLADVAAKELAATEVPDAPLNERLIRYYVTMGLLDPPARRGKEALFGVRQLMQLMAVRKLLSERFSLSQAREMFRVTDWSQVDAAADLLPRPVSKAPTQAEQTVARLKMEALSLASPSPMQRLRQSRQQLRMGAPAPAPAQAGAAGPRPVLRLTLTDWCEVLADPERIDSLADERAEELGKALTTALLAYRNRQEAGEKT
jgi:DNA-binding transcriptional MerR regulator